MGFICGKIRIFSVLVLALKYGLGQDEPREESVVRRVNSQGLLLIREFEDFNPYIVEDPYTGRRVIGYGHNCNTVWKKCTNLRPPITGHQANILLRTDLQPFERCITKCTAHQNITDDQYSALVSFAFSIGKSCEAIANSRLIKAVNSGNFLEAGRYFEKLISFEIALQKRRKAERALFILGSEEIVETQNTEV